MRSEVLRTKEGVSEAIEHQRHSISPPRSWWQRPLITAREAFRRQAPRLRERETSRQCTTTTGVLEREAMCRRGQCLEARMAQRFDPKGFRPQTPLQRRDNR